MAGQTKVLTFSEGTAVTAPAQNVFTQAAVPDMLENIGFQISVAASACTITLKRKDGATDPTAADPIGVGFRLSTVTTGGYSIVSATSTITLVIPSGATLGLSSAQRDRIYIYGINNAGTLELAVTGRLFSENELHDTIAISTGSDSKDFLYSTVARTSVPVKLIGHFDSEQATAGTWVNTSDEIFIGERTDETVNGYLKNFSYLDERSVPSTTNAYGWHNNGTSDFDGTAWIGGVNLTEIGAMTSAVNNIGQTTYIQTDGSTSGMYANSTAFDTTNESFTVGGWIYLSSPAAGGAVISKSTNTNADKSFTTNLAGGTNFDFTVYYNGSGSNVTARAPIGNLSSKLVHVALRYNQSDKTLTMFFDGKIVANKYDANLATRNNSANSKLTFGGYGNGTLLGSGSGIRVSDSFYFKYAATFDQIRKMYVTGTKKKAYVDENDKVMINGEKGNLGYYVELPTAGYAITSSWADVTGYEIYLPVSGLYKISSESIVSNIDSDAISEANIRLYDGSASLPGTFRRNYFSATGATAHNVSNPFHVEYIGYLTAGTKITLQAIELDSSSCQIPYSTSYNTPFIKWELLED